ncbi:MAG: AAA family ATPase [Myxococcaceae bacterium]|nr:AAA family ATPase [Myxococcaceae bacterium]
MVQKISPDRLRWQLRDLSAIRAALSIRPKRRKKGERFGAMAQERALSALELGLGIRQRGFNIFVAGDSGTGRTSTVKQLLGTRAIKEATPEDIVLLYNFENRDRPLAIKLASGLAPKLKKTYDTFVEQMLTDLERTFESERYLSERQELQDQCQLKTDAILNTIEQEAREKGFVLQRSSASLTITPANQNGEPISEQDFELLTEKTKATLEQSAERLEIHLEDSLRRVRVLEREAEEAIQSLERRTASVILEPIFETARAFWKGSPRVMSHLESCQEDVLNRLRRLIPDDRGAGTETPEVHSHKKRVHEDEEDYDSDEHALIRYRVNVFVTNAKGSGAPVVQETHPTSSNLIGRIEQRLRGGETITDHTRIRAGALYQANGGYLLLEAQDILRDPAAWEGLKRALKNRAVELDDPGEPGRMVSVASLRPEPVPLEIKVILIGVPEIYYLLSKTDPEFGKLFKVKADFDNEMTRTQEHIRRYVEFICDLCADEKLRLLTAEAVGAVIEEAVRISGHQNKLTSRIGDIADLVREANYWAAQTKSKRVDDHHIKKAIQAHAEREGFLQTHMTEDILENRVSIETEGVVVGQANAMTVIELGSYAFGVPLRVTCRVAAGKGDWLDIERETEQGGPIHTKGRLIIRGFLAHCFGDKIPMSFNAILCMEQTYGDIDGDSATLAETAALFSALANIPIRQHFAITGSMDQRGHIQAVGGVNEKIEGFFEVCKARKNSETHGVILPASNLSDLNLREEVVQACESGQFEIYGVKTFYEAIELLTGLSWDSVLEAKILKSLTHFRDLSAQPFGRSVQL